MKKMVARNEKCPCGSGLKYKKCCLAKQIEQDNEKLLNPPVKTADQGAQEIDDRFPGRLKQRARSRAALATMMGIVASQGDVFR
jgi:hypothetical protein